MTSKPRVRTRGPATQPEPRAALVRDDKPGNFGPDENASELFKRVWAISTAVKAAEGLAKNVQGKMEGKNDAPEVFGGAEAAMLQDIDAILARLEVGIAKERKAWDELAERIRQPAV